MKFVAILAFMCGCTYWQVEETVKAVEAAVEGVEKVLEDGDHK